MVKPPRPVPHPAAPDAGIRMTRVQANGTVYARRINFQVSRTFVGTIAYRLEEDDPPDLRLPGHPNHQRPAPRTTRPTQNPVTVRDVVIHELSEMS